MKSGIQTTQTAQPRRRGFTMIELLVAITIIAILAGLLLGGITAAMSSVSTAKASNEIKSLETALAQFYAEFGMYPPSRITLYEQASGWSGTDTVTVRSKALILQMWPNFDFSINRDLDGDGVNTGTFELNGSECLVFFLGGVLRNEAPIGFSKNPANPFDPDGSNRTGPFHEFQPDRLIGREPGSEWYKYADTYSGQQTPILYLSSYDGRGYRAVDRLIDPNDDPTNAAVMNDLSKWIIRDVYLQKAGGPAWKDKTYQLISPGADGLYGKGGVYDVKNKNQFNNDSDADWDNITNFSSGKLR